MGKDALADGQVYFSAIRQVQDNVLLDQGDEIGVVGQHRERARFVEGGQGFDLTFKKGFFGGDDFGGKHKLIINPNDQIQNPNDSKPTTTL